MVTCSHFPKVRITLISYTDNSIGFALFLFLGGYFLPSNCINTEIIPFASKIYRHSDRRSEFPLLKFNFNLYNNKGFPDNFLDLNSPFVQMGNAEELDQLPIEANQWRQKQSQQQTILVEDDIIQDV